MNACCQRPEHLREEASPDPGRPDITVLICAICGARHRRLRADPGAFGATPSPSEA